MTEQHDAPLPESYTPPKLDVDQFVHELDGVDMTEAEKIELLHILWDIMKRFVELGFGLNPEYDLCAHIIEKARENQGCDVD